MSKLRKLVRLIAIALLGAAIYEEMSKDPAERTGVGTVAGVVPYDFRPPTYQRIKDALWNPKDPRLIVPTVFGVGWTINFAQLFSRVSSSELSSIGRTSTRGNR